MAREKLSLNGVELNDLVSFGLSELIFHPAEAKPIWADNAGSSGALLVAEPYFTNAIFELTVRVRPQATADAAIEKLGSLADAIQSCARTESGVSLVWTPKDLSRTYTWTAILGEVPDLPTDMSGDLAGWLLKAPVIKLRVTCKPFGRVETRTAKSSTESSAAPLQELYVSGIKGDVPAEGLAILTDTATQQRRYLEWGNEVVTSEAGNPSLLLTAASLVITNFSGTSTTRSGAYSEEKVKRATAISQVTTMCGTGYITNDGSFRVYGRFYGASETLRVRISVRTGEGRFYSLPWVPLTVLSAFSRVYLGEAVLDTDSGKAEIRVEIKTTDGVPAEIDLNFLELIPTVKGTARVRGRANTALNKLLAYDTFLQAEANLDAPVAMPVGGSWSEASKVGANGFKVFAAIDEAERSTVSDGTLETGSFAIAGTEEPTNARATVTTYAGSALLAAVSNFHRGVFLRYKNTTNWVMAYLRNYSDEIKGFLTVDKCVEGVVTRLGSYSFSDQFWQTKPHAVSLAVSDTGTWQAWVWNAVYQTEAEPVLFGQDSALATGGSLAKGKSGMYDSQTVATATSRRYDNFSVMGGEAADVVCVSGSKVEIWNDAIRRLNASETAGAKTVLQPRGANFYLEPAGKASLINRLALLMRRTDVETESDSAVTDKHKIEVLVTERYLVPR